MHVSPGESSDRSGPFRRGIRSGWSSFVWMMKIVIPVSLFTQLLAWSGWLGKVDFLIQPVMEWLSLPAMAALPLMIGILANIYAGIAAMAVLPFTSAEMTLMAIFLLIAHNMIQEGIVQAKSGIGFVKAGLVRLIAAVVTVLAVAPFLETGAETRAAVSVPAQVPSIPIDRALLDWIPAVVSLGAKMFVIIMLIMIMMEIFKAKGWINNIARALAPLLRIMGLSREVGLLWLTAVVFGLAYGGALIIAESNAGRLKREDLETLHLSVGINHSMIEDPTLFLSLGLNPFWLWVPRLITAIVATRLITFYRKRLKRK
jgi:Fe2+ transport system protein B